MSLSTAAITCAAAGGACELAGLVFVIRDVVADRRRAAVLVEDLPPPETPKRSFPRPPARGSPPPLRPGHPLSMMGGRGSISSSHIRALRQEIYDLETSVLKGFTKTWEMASEEDDEVVRYMHEELAEVDKDLRVVLRETLAGSSRGRLIGATLLGVGIVLAMAGSILTSLA